MVVFLAISTVITPPKVSKPKDKGVTSKSRTSFTSPCRMPACTAAPSATTSSGLMFLCGSLPKSFLTASCMAGMRVCPPTKITSLISLNLKPASATAVRVCSMDFSISGRTKSSSLALVKRIKKCLGPLASVVINGMLISVSKTEESSCLAFSAASFSLCKARVSLDKSMP